VYTPLIQGLSIKNKQAIARSISVVENEKHNSRDFLSQIYPKTGNAYRIGVTGPPGAGKSSLTDQLIQQFREEEKSVAVVGVDPSSPFSGGALLGDRIRMTRHFSDDKVFIRSMASRGGHGGLAQKTQEVGDVLDAAGFDVIIFETVGVGQVELDVVQAADSVLVVLVPESGDDIQMMKAGLMEIADIFVINKADRSGANKLFISIQNLLSTIQHDENNWLPNVVKTIATESSGVSELVCEIQKHQNFIHETGIWKQKLNERYARQVNELISQKLQSTFWIESKQNLLQQKLKEERTTRLSPQELAKELLNNA
jgi:LAO/AO transport system kinase